MADEEIAVVDPQVTDEVDPKEGATEIKPSEETKVDDPKPGTPDKALQKVQQELGNLSRQFAALTEKKAAGELSEADKANLAKAQQRLQTIRTKAQDFGVAVEGGTELAEQVLDLTEKVTKQGSLEAVNRDLLARLDRLENDRNWQLARAKYAGLDVDAIWEKATTDADDVLGPDAPPASKNRLASRWFEERCDAAMKRKKEDPEPKKGAAGSPASTYKVGTGQRVAPVLSEEEDMLATARSLIVET